MITIIDKLFITEEVNTIVVQYAKEIVLKELLVSFSFDSTTDKRNVSELIQSIGYYNGDEPPPEDNLKLIDFIYTFTKALSKEKRIALNFWVLNENYLKYLDEHPDNNDVEEEFDQKFGRELAYKLYHPKSSHLSYDLNEALRMMLITFASEHDFSLIDEETYMFIDEVIESYLHL